MKNIAVIIGFTLLLLTSCWWSTNDAWNEQGVNSESKNTGVGETTVSPPRVDKTQKNPVQIP